MPVAVQHLDMPHSFWPLNQKPDFIIYTVVGDTLPRHSCHIQKTNKHAGGLGLSWYPLKSRENH
jgi:hypothetical protein